MPAKLFGIVHDQPDADAAIKAAIVEYQVPPNERGQADGAAAGLKYWYHLLIHLVARFHL